MREFRNAFFAWLPVCFVVAALLLWLMVEGIDLWYTLYYALGIVVALAAFVAFFGKTILTDWWNMRR
jgi:hypothetical protein